MHIFNLHIVYDHKTTNVKSEYPLLKLKYRLLKKVSFNKISNLIPFRQNV